MTRTYLTIAEKTSEKHRSLYILHNGWEWYHADTNIQEHMEDLLKFFECETVFDGTKHTADNGKIEFYNISKDIISKSGGGFWNLKQLQEMANGRRTKTFTGLSNGSLVTCYTVFNDDNTIEILRPNPNAKEVYNTMPLNAELEYRRNHWFL